MHLPKGAKLNFPSDDREAALLLIEGRVSVSGTNLELGALAVSTTAKNLIIEAQASSRVLFLGGRPVGERFLYWNFVSSSKTRLEEAKADWHLGPRKTSKRFLPISRDDYEFIPLPPDRK